MRTIFIILLIFITPYTFSQEVTSTSGNHFSNDNLQISWTVGEPVIETCFVGTFCITQGLHQSKLIITSVDKIENLNYKIMAFPNPAIDHVQLKIESILDENAQYYLYNMDGKLLSKQKLMNNKAIIPMAEYAPSTYLLRVTNTYDRILKTFKIIKNK